MATIKADRGRLLIDFAWKGQRSREFLGLDESKEGLAKARSIMKQITGEIAGGTFDFPKWFPESKKAQPGGCFAPAPPPAAPAGPPSFATYSREFLDLRKPFASVAHHADQVSLLEHHLIPVLGERLMSTFVVEDIERLLGGMKSRPGLKHETLSAVRINKCRSLLSQILERATKKGWLATNPVLEVNRLREDPAVIDPLSWTEVDLLLTKGFPNDPQMKRYFTVALFTGLRTSELIGLQWADLDFTSQPPQAHIKGAYTKLDKQHPTKTQGSARTIDLRPQVVKALKEQQATSRLKSEWVFCNAVGGPLDRDNCLNRSWYPSLRRAGIRLRNQYQTRHTFATLALQSGEQIGWVSQQLGHSNTEMVIRHYFKFIPNLTRRDGSAFDQAAAQAGL